MNGGFDELILLQMRLFVRTIFIDLMNEPCKGDFAYLYRIRLHFLLPPQLTHRVCKLVSWLFGYEGSSAVLFRATKRIHMSIVRHFSLYRLL
jgi:hypothetical protein